MRRGGAQIQAPGAGSSAGSAFQAPMPARAVRPSGWAIQAQSAPLPRPQATR